MTAILLLACLAACGQDMTSQEKMLPDRATELFPDGKVNQHPPAGTVSREAAGRDRLLAERPPLTRALMERGRERYGIVCQPCHGLAGDGDGIVPRHGFPHPPNYLDPKVLRAPDAQLVDVITHGYGVMYAYADRVAPADRWAIVAWLRVLQVARGAPAAWLDPELRTRLDQAAAGAGR